MRKTLSISILAIVGALLIAAPTFAQSATPGPKALNGVDVAPPGERADAATTSCHSHTTGGTCTITVGSVNSPTQWAYLTGADIIACQNATGATPAAPVFITVTGLNGNPQYMVGSGNTNAAVLGTCFTIPISFGSAPLRSATPGTNVVFTLPSFPTNETISLNVYGKLGAQ